MKKTYLLGLFVLAMLAIAGYFVLKTENLAVLFMRDRLYEIRGHFPSAAGMYPRAPVRLAGVKIGHVESISLDGRTALVRMLIDKKYPLSSDARAIISTVGFVGERYVEIVYKEEYAEERPATIRPGGEIQVIEPFSLDELKIRIDAIYARAVTMLDSINAIVGERQSRDSIHATLANLNQASGRLRDLLAEPGGVTRLLERAGSVADRLNEAVNAIDRFTARAESALGDDRRGMIADLQAAAGSIRALADDVREISGGLKRGQGTAGKLLTEDSLYSRLDQSAAAIQAVAQDLEKKTSSMKEWQTGLTAQVDYFARRRRARSALGLRFDARRFTLTSALSEEPQGGRVLVTALGGSRFRSLTVSAGLFESRLAAAARLGLLRDRVQLEMIASRFYGGQTPMLRALLSFSLNRNGNVFVQAGWADLLNRQQREMVVGFGLRSTRR